MASCSLVEDDQCFGRAHGLNNEGDPDGGGSENLLNISLLQRDYTAP
jgi:hypothetical protein